VDAFIFSSVCPIFLFCVRPRCHTKTSDFMSSRHKVTSFVSWRATVCETISAMNTSARPDCVVTRAECKKDRTNCCPWTITAQKAATNDDEPRLNSAPNQMQPKKARTRKPLPMPKRGVNNKQSNYGSTDRNGHRSLHSSSEAQYA